MIDRYCNGCLKLSTETSWSAHYGERLCMDCYNLRCEAESETEQEAESFVIPEN